MRYNRKVKLTFELEYIGSSRVRLDRSKTVDLDLEIQFHVQPMLNSFGVPFRHVDVRETSQIIGDRKFDAEWIWNVLPSDLQDRMDREMLNAWSCGIIVDEGMADLLRRA